MSEESWVLIHEVYGELEAEILRGLLESQGIPVFLNQEGAGRAYGLNVGSLGRTEVMVPASLSQEARQVLDDYYSGDYAEKGPEIMDSDESYDSGGNFSGQGSGERPEEDE